MSDQATPKLLPEAAESHSHRSPELEVATLADFQELLIILPKSFSDVDPEHVRDYEVVR